MSKSVAKTARNKQIAKLRRDGNSHDVIARVVGCSRQRVAQIIMQMIVQMRKNGDSCIKIARNIRYSRKRVAQILKQMGLK